LRHRVERGRGDIDRRLDRGVHELRDENERDRDEQRDQLDLRDSERNGRDQDERGDGEVDPEVPLRPKRVDEAFGGVIEAAEERGAPLAWRHVVEYAISRSSMSSPWS